LAFFNCFNLYIKTCRAARLEASWITLQKKAWQKSLAKKTGAELGSVRPEKFIK
jgi:hypothetical protein